MPARVSVVLASFANAERPVLEALDRQTMSTDQFEVLVLDDGADPEASERLLELAQNRPNVRAVPVDGKTPGALRNAGVAAASGDYVLFLDGGVVLGDEALERVCGYAEANSSDVCVAKTGQRDAMAAPRDLFAFNRPQLEHGAAALVSAGALWLYRREFLLGAGLRFAERDEAPGDPLSTAGSDPGFELEALSRAATVSVLADYAAASAPAAPALAAARGRLASLAGASAPAELREEGIHAEHVLSLDRLVDAEAAEHRAILAMYAGAVAEHVPESVDRGLGPARRALSAALRAGEVDRAATICAQTRAWRPRAREASATWRAGVLHVSLDVAPGGPTSGTGGEAAAAAAEIDPGDVTVGVLGAADGVEWLVATEDVEVSRRDEGRLRVDARLRPGVLAGGGPLPVGVWVVVVVIRGADSTLRLQIPCADRLPSASYDDGRVTASFADAGRLALDVGATQNSVVPRLRAARASVVEDARGSLLHAEVPRLELPDGVELAGKLKIGGLPVPATLRSENGVPALSAWVSGLAGSYPLATKFSTAPFTPTGLALEVDGWGAMTVRRVRQQRKSRRTRRPPAQQPRQRPAPAGGRWAVRLRRIAARVPGARAVYRRVRAARPRGR